MREVEYSGQFKRDLKRVKKCGKDMEKIKEPLQFLIEEETIPDVYLDHPLPGTGTDAVISILNLTGC